jgi:hypothetical protein
MSVDDQSHIYSNYSVAAQSEYHSLDEGQFTVASHFTADFHSANSSPSSNSSLNSVQNLIEMVSSGSFDFR